MLVACLYLLAPLHAFSQWSSARADGHAPIGVMGDHTHSKGEFMFSYRYMLMNMDGNRDGTESLSPGEVLRPSSTDPTQGYMVTPLEMPMQMHMFGVMYAPTDDLTLMAMVPFISAEMDHLNRMGGTFTTESGGLGDIKLGGLYKFVQQGNIRIHANFSVSLPTGDIEQRDDTPLGSNSLLPYPMQIGSGTYDLMPGVTYLGQKGDFSWGSQVWSTLRLGENSNDYALGNRFGFTNWVGYRLADWISPQLRLDFQSWGNIRGRDPRYAGALNGAPQLVHTVDPNLKAGTRLDLGIGTNFWVPGGALHHLRFGAEFLVPVIQDLDGPQMETDWLLVLGLQYAID